MTRGSSECRAVRRGAAAGALGLAAASCSSGFTNSEREVAALVHAVRLGDEAALYALLSPSDRNKLPFDAFRARMAAEREDFARLGEQLEKASHAPVRDVTWVDKDGMQPRVVLEAGEVHADPSLALPLLPRTPEQALHHLARALTNADLGDLFAILSVESRRVITGEIMAIVDGLADPEAIPVSLSGDRATASLKDGHVVRLVRAGAYWQVSSFE